jgi:AraC-like DNA-binding protein
MAILGGILGIHKQNFSSQLYVFIFQLSSVLYTLSIYLILCLHIRKHNRLIKEEYSNSENRNLNWLLYLFAAYIGCALLIVLLRSTNLIERSIRQYFELFFQMGWYIILFYKTLHYELSTSYIYQQNSSPHPSKYALKNEKEETKTFSSNFKNTKTELAQEELKKFFQQIEHTVVKKALYLNPTLTISDVNKETKIQPWIISKAIHTQKHNFNTYINELRIEHAQKLLLSQEQEHLSIEGIGKIAGFKSNSAFYRAFYNVHHTTPLQYKKERKCS